MGVLSGPWSCYVVENFDKWCSGKYVIVQLGERQAQIGRNSIVSRLYVYAMSSRKAEDSHYTSDVEAMEYLKGISLDGVVAERLSDFGTLALITQKRRDCSMEEVAPLIVSILRSEEVDRSIRDGLQEIADGIWTLIESGVSRDA